MKCSSTSGVLVVAALVLTGCGGGARSEEPADGERTLRVVSVAFPARQHLAQRATFAITLRNAGDMPIASAVGTLRGLSERAPDGTGTKLWIADEPRAGSIAAIGDARASSAIDPGEDVTLRWVLTATAAGTHELSWEVPGADRPRGALTVRVSAKPPLARVILAPRGDRVIREKSAPSGYSRPEADVRGRPQSPERPRQGTTDSEGDQ